MDTIKKGLVLDIQRMSTEDGPGLRTTVFFKGCSLSCAWCHNPESISTRQEVQWVESRCIGCRSCVKACMNEALLISEEGIRIDRNRCIFCLRCVKSCPANAMESKGSLWGVDELVSEVLKDRVYFDKSGGGVTASGGEALLQHEFLGGFFKRLREENIHTALDTAGMVGTDNIDSILPYVKLFLYDIKLMDPEKHKRYTGSSSKTILRNLVYIADRIRKNSLHCNVWIRTPIIPGATASEQNIIEIGKFIADCASDVVSRWELCAFNNLCRDKYRRLDRQWEFDSAPLMTREDMEKLLAAARSSGVNKDIAIWTGAVRVEE